MSSGMKVNPNASLEYAALKQQKVFDQEFALNALALTIGENADGIKEFQTDDEFKEEVKKICGKRGQEKDAARANRDKETLRVLELADENDVIQALKDRFDHGGAWEKQCRFISLNISDSNHKRQIIVIRWSSDDAPTKMKMVYASSNDAIKEALSEPNITQLTDKSDFDLLIKDKQTSKV